MLSLSVEIMEIVILLVVIFACLFIDKWVGRFMLVNIVKKVIHKQSSAVAWEKLTTENGGVLEKMMAAGPEAKVVTNDGREGLNS